MQGTVLRNSSTFHSTVPPKDNALERSFLRNASWEKVGTVKTILFCTGETTAVLRLTDAQPFHTFGSFQ